MENPESPKKPPKTVTLEVTPKQAEIVAQATRMGTLSLALRGLPPGMNRVKHVNFANEPLQVQSLVGTPLWTVMLIRGCTLC